MADELRQPVGQLHPPDPRAAVEASRRDRLAVRREGDAGDSARVTGEGVDQLARGDVPQPRGVVIAARQQIAAVGRKGQVLYPVLMTREDLELLPTGRIPKPDIGVIAAASYVLP